MPLHPRGHFLFALILLVLLVGPNEVTSTWRNGPLDATECSQMNFLANELGTLVFSEEAYILGSRMVVSSANGSPHPMDVDSKTMSFSKSLIVENTLNVSGNTGGEGTGLGVFVGTSVVEGRQGGDKSTVVVGGGASVTENAFVPSVLGTKSGFALNISGDAVSVMYNSAPKLVTDRSTRVATVPGVVHLVDLPGTPSHTCTSSDYGTIRNRHVAGEVRGLELCIRNATASPVDVYSPLLNEVDFAASLSSVNATMDPLEALVRVKPPEIPLMPACGVITPTTVGLSWTPQSDRGAPITTYKVYQDDVLIHNSNTLTHTATGLSFFTEYKFGVEARNWKGTGQRVNITCKTIPGPPAQLSMVQHPSVSTNTMVVFAQQPIVHVLDADGNLVTYSSLTVTLSLTTGTGAISGTAAVAAVGGIVTFSGLRITVFGNSKVMTATGAGVTSATTNAFNIVSVCQDGIVENLEECDDNNNVAGDGCSTGCVRESCGAAPIATNGNFAPSCPNIKFGDTCTYACNGGYQLTGGSLTRTCGTSFTWSVGPTCTNIDECGTGTHSCGANTVCGDTAGSYTCTCSGAGFGSTLDVVYSHDFETTTGLTLTTDAGWVAPNYWGLSNAAGAPVPSGTRFPAILTGATGSYLFAYYTQLRWANVDFPPVNVAGLTNLRLAVKLACAQDSDYPFQANIENNDFFEIWVNGVQMNHYEGVYTGANQALLTNTAPPNDEIGLVFAEKIYDLTSYLPLTTITIRFQMKTSVEYVGIDTYRLLSTQTLPTDTCVDSDECALGTHNCDINANCINSVGSFSCACKAGYTGSGTTCTYSGTVPLVNTCDQGSFCYADVSRAASCQAYKNPAPGYAAATVDGLYSITTNNRYVWCDMTTDGGGWMLIEQYEKAANVLPTIFNAIPTADTGHRGHAYNAQFGFTTLPTEVRFYCFKSNPGRTIHFKTNALSTRQGVHYSFSGADYFSVADFTNDAYNTFLSGHNGNLPKGTNAVWEAAYGFTSNDLMTEFPFWTSGLYHWGTGSLSRWECDDYATAEPNTGTWQIWVRN